MKEVDLIALARILQEQLYKRKVWLAYSAYDPNFKHKFMEAKVNGTLTEDWRALLDNEKGFVIFDD